MKKYILALLLSISSISFSFSQTLPPCLAKFDDGRCRIRGTVDKDNKDHGYYIEYFYQFGEYQVYWKGNYNHGQKVGTWYEFVSQDLLEDYEDIFQKMLKENGLNLSNEPEIKEAGQYDNGKNIHTEGGKVAFGSGAREPFYMTSDYGKYISRYIFNVKTGEKRDSNDYSRLRYGYVWYENNEAIAAWKEPITSHADALTVKTKITNTFSELIQQWKQKLEMRLQQDSNKQ